MADEPATRDDEPATTTEGDQAPVNLDKTELEPSGTAGRVPSGGKVDPSLLERPESAGSEETDESDESDQADDEPAPAGDDVDQEEAFRSDEAPEAEVLATEPADSRSRAPDERRVSEGGGPIRDQDEEELDRAADEAAAQIEAESPSPDEEEAPPDEPAPRPQPQRVEDLMNDIERDEGGVEQPSDEQQAPPAPGEPVPGEPAPDGQAPPAPDEPVDDESGIDRPSLRSAPQPSRPGE